MAAEDTISPEFCSGGIQEAEQEDSNIKPILNCWKASNVEPPWSEIVATSNLIKNYWTQWHSLVLHNGVLCRKWQNSVKCTSFTTGRTNIREVLQIFHDGSLGRHLKVKSTLLKFRERFIGYTTLS